MQTITVGKTTNVTFIPIDQNGNPNPVGPDGQPLQVVGIPVWTTEEPAPPNPTRRLRANLVTGFTLTPAADGLSCNVTADVAGTVAILVCTADRGDGVMVFGSAEIEAIPEQGPTLVIASLALQFGPEQ